METTSMSAACRSPEMKARKTFGFSLIEVMIALVILGVLIAVGVPSFRAWILNSQIRNGAEAVMNGIQVARGEAIRRNQAVQIVLTPEAGDAPATWRVSEVVSNLEIQSWSAAEGATGTTMTALPEGALTVTFNGLGRVVTNADNSVSMQQVDISSSATLTPEIRPMRVVLGAAGSVRMCDPRIEEGDPRAC